MHKVYIFNEPLSIDGREYYGFFIGCVKDENISDLAGSKYVGLVLAHELGSGQYTYKDVFSYDWDSRHHKYGEVFNHLFSYMDFDDGLLCKKEKYEKVKESGYVVWREISNLNTEILNRAKSQIQRDYIAKKVGWSNEDDQPTVLRYQDFNNF